METPYSGFSSGFSSGFGSNVLASQVYGIYKIGSLNGVFDLLNDTIKIALMTSDHHFDDTNNYWGEIATNEISGTGYTTDGLTLTNKTISIPNNASIFTADDSEWQLTAPDVAYAVVYDSSAVNDPLILSIDFGGLQSLADTLFTLEWQLTGILSLG
jgi:hypothetical protein